MFATRKIVSAIPKLSKVAGQVRNGTTDMVSRPRNRVPIPEKIAFGVFIIGGICAWPVYAAYMIPKWNKVNN